MESGRARAEHGVRVPVNAIALSWRLRGHFFIAAPRVSGGLRVVLNSITSLHYFTYPLCRFRYRGGGFLGGYASSNQYLFHSRCNLFSRCSGPRCEGILAS